jgi:hypothetical protein
MDSSGHGTRGILMGKPRWIAEPGGGLQINERGSFVQINTSDSLDSVQEGSYSLAALFHPDREPTVGMLTAAPLGLFTKGSDDGLFYTADRHFVMRHNWGPLPGDSGSQQEPPADLLVTATADKSFGPGKYYQVVGLFRQEKNTLEVYVNGHLEGVGSWNTPPRRHDTTGAPWILGRGARGRFRDVRVYSRALETKEVEALYKMTCPDGPLR